MSSLYKSLITLLLVPALFSCNEAPRESADLEEIQYSAEVAQIISQITAGSILPDSKIEVSFVESVVGEDELNKKIENPFTFSPSVPGDAMWTRTNLLSFSPSDRMESGLNYTGKIDLSMFSKQFDVTSVDIKFYVEGVEVTSFSAELELINPTNPNQLVYRGKVAFSQKVNLKALKEAASLSSSSLSWNQESDESFSFVSAPLDRQSETKEYSFRIDRSDLDLSESIERTVKVVPLSQLQVSAFEKDESGKSPNVRLKFSDQLDAQQDVNGFISVNPEVDFKIQKLGRYIILDGDFKFGQEYTVKISAGVKSKWGTKTSSSISEKIRFADIEPQVEFSSGGIFMPTSNNKRLQFLTTNLKRVHVEVKKVFDQNIERFFSNESLKSSKDRNTEFENSYISTVGAIIYNQTFEIGDTKNEWLIHNLALDNVLSEYSNGLYLIRINFNPQDVLTALPGDELSYIQKRGQIFKPVTISDIGIIAKHHDDNLFDVFTTDLKTGAPLSGVRVETSKRRNNSGITNSEGKVTVSGYSRSMITASKSGQISIIKPYEMEWNKSGFDVDGISSRDLKTRGYTYTERGVYRPGDSINLSFIVRYSSGGKNNAPAYLSLYNPEGTLVHEDTQTGAKDGFYNFKLGTDQNDPTGNWNAQVSVGNKYFYHTLKVETVVANRLKVKITPDIKTILPENKRLSLTLESKYLFGASASGLPYDSEVEIFEQRSVFPKYKEYNFFNQYIEFKDIKSKVSTGNLNEDGKSEITWNVPNLRQAPAPLLAKITATVQEEGGRPNNAWTFVDVHPFSRYVGIKNNNRYVKLNSKNDIPVVLVDHEGNSVAGKELVYRIYRNDSYWWYQYDNFRSFKLRFKTDKHSFLVEEGTLTSGKPYTTVPFQPAQKGQYLIEVQDADNQGHISSVFISAYPYGGIPSGDLNAGTLSLRTEKETYEIGDEATITFPSPKQGNILLTVERADQILMSKWVKPAEDEEDMQIKLPITKEMVPNSYVTVTAMQNHSQTINDRPIRMFGILPINVVDPNTKQALIIDMPDELKPKQSFDIDISTRNKRATQFTVAVVDEGLLDLTNFQTPDPWKEFFKKIRLDVDTHDLFGYVIGANEGDVFKTFSIGGDMDYRESQVDPFKKKKRFKPVCMFKGPITTDSDGKAKVSFTMPNYVGSVRVMVISAKGDTYGRAEKTVPVRSDLIVQPTIPRALKPGDEFDIPVNVFATKSNIGSVNLNIETEGPIEVVGKKSIQHTFNEEDDKLFYFKAKVKSAIGQSKITISCKGKNAESVFEADVPVSPSAARVYEKTEKTIKPGETISIKIPKTGIDGTNNARLHLAVFPNMDFLHRLDFLIRYPYGCIEQTTSSVFPQLVLKSFLSDDLKLKEEVDKNINAGINRLRMFQLGNGGFSYWPGGNEASSWGSNYAAQFLIEARKQGYVVPDAMYDGIVRYLQRETRRNYSDKKWLMTRVNRCYVLALANEAPLEEMNLLKQNHYDQMNNVQKWQLVASYKLAGALDKVQGLVSEISTEVDEYSEFSHTYGSHNRDMGIILRCLIILERDEDATLMAKYVAEVLSGRNWYSTQTVGQMLLAIGDYFENSGISTSKDLLIEGEVILPNGSKEVIKSVDKYALYINEGYGGELKLKLNKEVDINKLYATVSSNGVPLIDLSEEESKNIALKVDWFNEDGQSIDIAKVAQGDTFYGHYRVSNNSVVPAVDEVALVQLLPSGWEIENMRLSDAILPDWMSDYNTDKEDYLDIRDDRIMWFFDLHKGQPLDFIVKVNAITQGTFTLPGARCEAMYNNDFVATKEGRSVQVVNKE